MNKLLILSLSSIIFFASCSKDKTNTTIPETTTQKLQHKWNLVSIEDIQYLGSSTTQIEVTTDEYSAILLKSDVL